MTLVTQESKDRLAYLIDVFMFEPRDIELNCEVLTWPKRIMPVFDENDNVRYSVCFFYNIDMKIVLMIKTMMIVIMIMIMMIITIIKNNDNNNDGDKNHIDNNDYHKSSNNNNNNNNNNNSIITIIIIIIIMK